MPHHLFVHAPKNDDPTNCPVCHGWGYFDSWEGEGFPEVLKEENRVSCETCEGTGTYFRPQES